MANGKFVSYFRVSTKKQGLSGLGLEAQQQAVRSHLNGGKWDMLGEFVEVETGKHSNRPKLLEALALCKKHKATLIIAKLDRLSRNVAFLANLMESKIEFVCCDNPHASKAMLHMMAVFAEMERDMISKRTKEALAASKARGKQLGLANPLRTDRTAVSDKGVACRQVKAENFADNVRPIIDQIKASGVSTLQNIATALNARGIKSPRGGQWYPASVERLIKRSS